MKFRFWPFNRQSQPAAVTGTPPSYIMTNDGNITLRWNGNTHSIGKTHRNYDAIVAALFNKENERLDSLLDAAVQLERAVEGVTVNEYGEVFYRGERANGLVADKIGDFIRNKLPYKPLARFLTNLMENPSERSRNELYGFLAHQGFPITHDGCFLAYKGITKDYKDIHTKSFDNSIGSVNEMPREKVDPNAAATCSVGFHVGTYEYARDFARGDGGVVVLVKVNPKDAVSVPLDHDASKLRVCRYEVVEICEAIVPEPLYVAAGDVSEYDDTEEDEDECPSCGSLYCEDGECEEDDYDDEDDDEGDALPLEEIESSTGRRRGPGGRFLPAN